jgi:glutamyl-tRNA synthetase
LAEFVLPYSLFVCQKNNGVLRIEDTDQNRFVPGAEAHGSIRMVGIPPDETIGKMKNLVLIVKAKKTLYREYADQ